MRQLMPLLAFAGVAVVAVMLVLGLKFGVGLRYVVWARPSWALAAVVPLAAVVWRAWSAPRPATMLFSRARSLSRFSGGAIARMVMLPDGLRLAAGVFLALALARPQSTRGSDKIRHEGIDIVIVLDMSDSMESPDMVPNRLGASQIVIDDFIRRRPHDRIGLVVFGAVASTVSPLTMDHGVLRTLVSRLRLGVMDGSTTAIGAGLGMALNRLGDSDADSKIVVLLTDGVHNADGLDPDAASSAAADRGVQVYTILMGQQRVGDSSIDPSRLERIASVTGGYAYTAEDQGELHTTFQDLLDKLETSIIEGQAVRPELFQFFLWPALGLLLLDILLRSTRLRRFP
ncbi:MAG: VWA domain-containing protein [Nannocystaceae bacterium]|nr:VWA domain-containing protein [Nannocystaceae bacterium]